MPKGVKLGGVGRGRSAQWGRQRFSKPSTMSTMLVRSTESRTNGVCLSGHQVRQGSSISRGAVLGVWGRVSALCSLDTKRSFPRTKGSRCWVYFESNSLRIRSMGRGWRSCGPRQSPNPHGGEKGQDWTDDFPHTHCPPPGSPLGHSLPLTHALHCSGVNKNVLDASLIQ